MDYDVELKDLQARMKDDWDQRIRHDYRYWMSDGVKSDDEMWDTGSRDFEILTNGISDDFLVSARVLDLGCGVGRILKAASEVCSTVTGIDVSEEAIEKARTLLSQNHNINLLKGDGSSLSFIESDSIDLIISFAALGSIPARVVAEYFEEMSRVIKTNGLIRIQVYLGREQFINENDTLALRSYKEERFYNALKLAGFEIDYKQEVILPFEVSDYTNGIIAYVIGARKISKSTKTSDEILNALVAVPEERRNKNWEGSNTAYLVGLARVKQHLEHGEIDEAEKSLEFALKNYKGDLSEAMSLKKDLNRKKEDLSNIRPQLSSSKNEFSDNKNRVETIITFCEEHFADLDDPDKDNKSAKFKIFNTIDGAAIEFGDICLSHRTSPKKAALNWAKRAMNTLKNPLNPILVVGLGDGYFIEALKELCNSKIYVYEDSKELIDLVDNVYTHSIKIFSSLNDLDILVNNELNGIYPELVILPSVPFYAEEMLESVRHHVTSRQLFTELKPRTAVVGPLCGGTLPIAEYINRAFQKLGLSSDFVDLSSYYPSLNSFSKFLQKPQSKGKIENQFVDLLSDLVLQFVEEQKIDILISVAQAPLTPEVLNKCREKGVITVHWFMEDTRRFPAWRDIARHYDYFFIIQKGESLLDVQNAGAKRAYYLPLACDPEIHKPLSVTPSERLEFGSNVSFVGAGYNNRRLVFSKLIRDDFKIWGSEWPDAVPFSTLVQRRGARVSVNDYLKIFNSSTINLNLHSSQERNGVDPTGDFVNPRTFELAACKAFQLTDNRSLLSELFSVEEIPTFENEKEMKEKIDYFLDNPEERRVFIDKAYVRVLEEHTYEHRAKKILELIYSHYGDHLRSREKKDSWKKTLEAAKSDNELYQYLLSAKERGANPQMDSIVRELLDTKGVLNGVEQKLMFMHHMKGQITQINRLRKTDES
jgi:spore maturation protein CgeB